MLNPRALERTREHLDTFLSTVRPSPSLRQDYDVSYQLSEVAFVLNAHRRAREADVLTAQACFKAVHSEAPEGWQLFVQDADGHWVSLPEGQGFEVDLEHVLQVAHLYV